LAHKTANCGEPASAWLIYFQLCCIRVGTRTTNGRSHLLLLPCSSPSPSPPSKNPIPRPKKPQTHFRFASLLFLMHKYLLFSFLPPFCRQKKGTPIKNDVKKNSIHTNKSTYHRRTLIKITSRLASYLLLHWKKNVHSTFYQKKIVC